MKKWGMLVLLLSLLSLTGCGQQVKENTSEVVGKSTERDTNSIETEIANSEAVENEDQNIEVSKGVGSYQYSYDENNGLFIGLFEKENGEYEINSYGNYNDINLAIFDCYAISNIPMEQEISVYYVANIGENSYFFKYEDGNILQNDFSDFIEEFSIPEEFSQNVVNVNSEVESFYNSYGIGSKAIESDVTLGMKNALEQAERYLDLTGFSYQGIIEQLEYEKYTHEEAVYAADNCGADWKEEAVKKAKEYLNLTSFPRQGLIEQLKYDKFTDEEAEYAVDKIGY